MQVAFSETKTLQKKRSPRIVGDAFTQYLREVGRIPLLSNGEEISEGKRVQAMMGLLQAKAELTKRLGHAPTEAEWAADANLSVLELQHAMRRGERAKKRMIEANLRLVISVAKKYQHHTLDILDLIQEGTLGLERAVEKYDPMMGYKFSTYAYWWIRQGITRAIAQQGRTIRLPIHITERLNKIRRIQRELSQSLGRVPTAAEIGDQLDLSVAEIKEYLSLMRSPLSLDVRVGEDQDTELVDLIEDESSSPEEIVSQHQLEQATRDMLAKLTPMQQDVICLRYGLYDGEALTLQKVGDRLGISRERVRQIQRDALNRLRLKEGKLRLGLS